MSKKLLIFDAFINLVLGVLLLSFSEKLATFLGVPYVTNHFYPNILGAIFIGITIALLIEVYKKNENINEKRIKKEAKKDVLQEPGPVDRKVNIPNVYEKLNIKRRYRTEVGRMETGDLLLFSIKGLSTIKNIRYNDKGTIHLFKEYGWDGKDYLLSVKANKFHQKYFKDKKIINLSLNKRDGFERKSDRMNAYFSLQKPGI